MPDKKNEISEEEMKKASGGASYSLSAKKTENRNQMSPTGMEQPAEGRGHLDPLAGSDLQSVRGGVPGNISAQKAGKRDQMSPTAQNEPDDEGRSHLDPTVKP